MSEDEGPRRLRLRCGMLDGQLNRQVHIWTGLDTKAGLLVGFVVASVAEILGFVILAATEHPGWARSANPWPMLLLFGGGLGFVALASLWGALTLWPRKMRTGVEFDPTNEAEEIIAERLTRCLEENDVAIRTKQRRVKWCGCFVLLGIFCQMSAAFWLLFLFSR